MITEIANMLSYTFMARAMVVGILVSLCAALLGVSLVLKQYSMIGDGLSHVGFGALAIAAVANLSELYVAIPVVILSAFLLLKLNESSKIKADSAIALISTGALAIGVLLMSVSGMNKDLNSYMFGSILSMSKTDVVVSIVLSLAVLILYVFLYNKVFCVTFDESFAKTLGIRADLYNTMIAILTAVTIVLGMRMMGTLLISGLIIFPALTSMRLCKTFRSVTFCSAILSVLCFAAGLTVSFFCDLPAGASVVIINIVCFLGFSLISLLKKH